MTNLIAGFPILVPGVEEVSNRTRRQRKTRKTQQKTRVKRTRS
jgi:hypothetical protein